MPDISREFLKSFQAEYPNRINADIRDLSLRVAYGATPSSFTSNGQNNVPMPDALVAFPKTSSQSVGWIFHLFFYPSAIPSEFRTKLLPYFWIYSIFGLFFFLVGIVDMASCKGHGTAWTAGFKLAGLLAAAFVTVAFNGNILFSTIRSSRLAHGELTTIMGEFAALQPRGRTDKQFFPALDRWANDHGYEIAAITSGSLVDTHRFPEIPQNAIYQAALLWKPGLFDRVGLSWVGVYSRAPEILVQSASADSASEIFIMTPVWSQVKAEADAGNVLKKDLHDSLKQSLASVPASSQSAASGGAAGSAAAPDLSEPLGLLRAWADAQAAGDFPAAEALCSGSKETLRLMEAAAPQGLELVRLNDSMSQVFGHNPNIASSPTDQAREVVRQVLLQATVLKTDPDHATAYPQGSDKMILRRIDGQWKLDWIASYLPADYQPRPGDFALYQGFYVRPVQRLTQDVLAGKFKTLNEAMAAYNQLRGDWNRIPTPLRDDMTRKQASDVADRYRPLTTQPAATQSAGPATRL